VNVYRFAKLAGRLGAFSGTASKVVNGKEIVMGSGEWTYDAGKQAMECKAPAIRLVVDGNKIEGSLMLQGGDGLSAHFAEEGRLSWGSEEGGQRGEFHHRVHRGHREAGGERRGGGVELKSGSLWQHRRMPSG
jgi:hypothetical protein